MLAEGGGANMLIVEGGGEHADSRGGGANRMLAEGEGRTC